jgi:hypothetical protein
VVFNVSVSNVRVPDARLPDTWEQVPPPGWRGDERRYLRAWVRLPPHARLQAWLTGGGHLQALQLYARGYSPAQIGPLVGPTRNAGGAEALALLHEAARQLGTHTLGSAVTEARRRGLIL